MRRILLLGLLIAAPSLAWAGSTGGFAYPPVTIGGSGVIVGNDIVIGGPNLNQIQDSGKQISTIPTLPIPSSEVTVTGAPGDLLCNVGGVVGDCRATSGGTYGARATNLLSLYPNAGTGSDDAVALNNAAADVEAVNGELDIPYPSSGAYNVCEMPLVLGGNIHLKGIGFQIIQVLPGCNSGTSFTGSIAPVGGSTLGLMTVTGATPGTVLPGFLVVGAAADTVIDSQVSGVPGGNGTYYVTVSQTLGSTSLTTTLSTPVYLQETASPDNRIAIDHIIFDANTITPYAFVEAYQIGLNVTETRFWNGGTGGKVVQLYAGYENHFDITDKIENFASYYTAPSKLPAIGWNNIGVTDSYFPRVVGQNPGVIGTQDYSPGDNDWSHAHMWWNTSPVDLRPTNGVGFEVSAGQDKLYGVDVDEAQLYGVDLSGAARTIVNSIVDGATFNWTGTPPPGVIAVHIASGVDYPTVTGTQAYGIVVNYGGANVVFQSGTGGAHTSVHDNPGATYQTMHQGLNSTLAASNSPSLQWFNLIDNDYTLKCTNIIPATSGALYLQFSESGGWVTSGYNWAIRGIDVASNNIQVGSASASGFDLGDNGSLANTANYGLSFTINLHGLLTPGIYKYIEGNEVALTTGFSKVTVLMVGGSYPGDTNAINGFRIIPASGNITSGFCSAYLTPQQ